MNDIKGKAMFVLEVSLAFALVYAFQKNIKVIPVIGEYLPGGQ